MSAAFIDHSNAVLINARADFDRRGAPKPDDSGNALETTTKETVVYFWHLTVSASTEPPPWTQSLRRMRDPISTEAVISVRDGRKKVAEKHFNDKDGKYRAIVKLFLFFEKQSNFNDDETAWPIATGWLVAPDVVVTAGHCAFDYSNGLGRLVKVRAYIGYKGKKDLSGTEARWGAAVATTVEWCSGIGQEPSDISFIKLDSPFTTVTNCFGWMQTPVSQDAADLGVVGYPGDIMDDTERGARMYEMFSSTTYNLANSDKHMLQYKVDTYGGNSGSPVFNNRQSLVAIGIHVLGGYSYNSGSVFDGRYGNRFMALQITASDLTSTEHPNDATFDLAQQMLSASLSQANKVLAPISGGLVDSVPSDLSFGPDVGPEISILAAAAIANAGRLAADSQSGSHAESLAGTRPYDGIIGRAVLAEAALQYYSSKSLSDGSKKQVEEFMAPLVAGLTPFVLKVAPRLLKGVLEPSFRLLLSRISGKTTPEDVRHQYKDEVELDTGFGRPLEGMESDFFTELLKYAKEDEKSSESFLKTMTTVGDFIGSAFKKAGPVLADVAKIGLPLLLGPEGGVASTKTNLDPLAHRAIAAEACLQSFVQLHKKLNLDKKFYNYLLERVKNLGPRLFNVAPHVVKFVGPIVGDILREIEEKKKLAEKKQEFLDFTYGH